MSNRRITDQTLPDFSPAGPLSPLSSINAYSEQDIEAIRSALAALALLAQQEKDPCTASVQLNDAAQHLSSVVERYVQDRDNEYRELQGLVSRRTAERMFQEGYEAWERDGQIPQGPEAMRLVERHIQEMRDELRNGDVIARFRRDLSDIASGRLRFSTAVTRRPYWRELLRMMRVTAETNGLINAKPPRWVHRLAQDREGTRECARKILEFALFRRPPGRKGDPAAHRLTDALDHIAQCLSGRRIARSINEAAAGDGPRLAPGLRLLIAALKPVKPSLTVEAAVELVRALPHSQAD